MATKQTGIKLNVSAVNSTGRVFKNIASSAMSVTASIAKWGAAAAGIALGGFAVMAKQLGALSDIAAAAGATTEEITKLSGALDILGIKGSKPEVLAAALQRMTKTTGQVGVEGFHKVIEEISKLPTVQDRATAAMQAFGRTGLQFLPLIEGAAKNGVGALKEVEAAMPGISQAAADAGDAASDAMSIMWNGIKSVFAEGVGHIARLIDSDFKGGVREAAMVGAAQMKFFAEVGFRYVGTFMKNFRTVCQETFQWLMKILNNALTAIGGLIVSVFEDVKSRIGGVMDDIAAGAASIFERLKGNDEAADQILTDRWKHSKMEAADRKKNWSEYFKLMEGLDWKYEGVMAGIDISDLQAQRDAAVATAKAAGEAYGKAAVKVGAVDLAKIKTGDAIGGRKAADKTNPEAIMGGSYKALTYALRQGYATGIAEVKNLLKKAVEGINGVKTATEDVADNLDFATM